MPIKETREDQLNEQRFAQLLSSGGFHVYALPQFSAVDFLVIKRSTLALVEYKRRHMDSGRFSTYIFPADKLSKSLQVSESLRVPLYLMFEFDDKIKYCNSHAFCSMLPFSQEQVLLDSRLFKILERKNTGQSEVLNPL